MSSILNILHIRSTYLIANPSSVSHHAGSYLIFNFMWAYILSSSRTMKMHYGVDHNVAPREDISKYCEQAVQESKMSHKTFRRLRRNEAAHANAVENYTLFVGAGWLQIVIAFRAARSANNKLLVLFALHARLPPSTLNAACAVYSVARTLYTFIYIFNENETLSWARTVVFWIGNLSCLSLLWKGSYNI